MSEGFNPPSVILAPALTATQDIGENPPKAGASNDANTPGLRGTNYAGGDGVLGVSIGNQHAGVSAIYDSGGFGVWARARVAGHFQGNVEVTGDILLTNGDCAEEFDILEDECAEPGTVMVIDHEGSLKQSRLPYDKCVAGVVAGAGDCKPAITLGRQESTNKRMPISLVGKAYCKVDAHYAPIKVGDLLTTSPTPGHAMKAADPLTAFGAVIGKALRPLKSGRGLIPILIALQ